MLLVKAKEVKMYSIKDAYDIAKEGVKTGFITAVGVAAAISALGVCAHLLPYVRDQKLDNYSLKNRFETAYSFKTPESNKYFYVTPSNVAGKNVDAMRERYLASPYATYSLIALLSMLGGVVAVKKAHQEIKRKKIRLRILKKKEYVK